MKPRQVEAGGVRGHKLGLDLVERQRRRIDDARPGRTVGEQRAWHYRAGIEANRTARDEIAAAHRDQVHRARPGADEMHGHGTIPGAVLGAASCIEAASAHVAVPTTSRDAIRFAAGPAAASAAASATDGTPMSASERSDLVAVRPLAALRSVSDTTITATPSFSAAPRIPASPLFASMVAITSSASAVILARASAARMAASISGADVPRLQPTPAAIMVLSKPIASPASPLASRFCHPPRRHVKWRCEEARHRVRRAERSA